MGINWADTWGSKQVERWGIKRKRMASSSLWKITAGVVSYCDRKISASLLISDLMKMIFFCLETTSQYTWTIQTEFCLFFDKGRDQKENYNWCGFLSSRLGGHKNYCSFEDLPKIQVHYKFGWWTLYIVSFSLQ